VYIPIDDAITKNDVKVKFEAREVSVEILGEEIITFQCLERLIPDGSFWVMERDKEGQRYLQLDLEKRYRMINWKSLFGEAAPEDVKQIEDNSKSMMEKLFAANKGSEIFVLFFYFLFYFFLFILLILSIMIILY
jgi:hypothetical protein